MDVAGDKEIKPAVAIVVAKAGTGRPVAERNAGAFTDVGKGAVMIVVVEPVLAVVGHVEVGPAVIVEVAHGHSEAPAVVGHAGLGSNVGKGAVVVVVKQGGVRRFS